MPYARMHYPFENKKQFEEHFPADFIAEGLDQTRGWFYTLVVLASALFDRPPFKNVLVNGLILAENGQKMSKRLKNYPDPMVVVNTYGADALRLFMLGSQVVRAEDLKFSEAGVKEILRGVMIPMWNALSFFTTYANVDGYEPPARGGAAAREGVERAGPLDSVVGLADGRGDPRRARCVQPAEGREPVQPVHRRPDQLVYPPQPPPVLEIERRRRQARGVPDAALCAADLCEDRRAVHPVHDRGDLPYAPDEGDAGVGSPLRLSGAERLP